MSWAGIQGQAGSVVEAAPVQGTGDPGRTRKQEAFHVLAAIQEPYSQSQLPPRSPPRGRRDRHVSAALPGAAFVLGLVTGNYKDTFLCRETAL